MGIEIYPPKTEVTVADGELEGTINAVAIYAHGGILYEIVWWKDGSRNSAWLSRSEFSLKNWLAPTKIGYITSQDAISSS